MRRHNKRKCIIWGCFRKSLFLVLWEVNFFLDLKKICLWTVLHKNLRIFFYLWKKLKWLLQKLNVHGNIEQTGWSRISSVSLFASYWWFLGRRTMCEATVWSQGQSKEWEQGGSKFLMPSSVSWACWTNGLRDRQYGTLHNSRCPPCAIDTSAAVHTQEVEVDTSSADFPCQNLVHKMLLLIPQGDRGRAKMETQIK